VGEAAETAALQETGGKDFYVHNLALNESSPKIGIIIPACDEEACIGAVLDELLRTVDLAKFVVVVGVNGSSDRTAQIARSFPVLVAETARRGYGHGCQAAIDLVSGLMPGLRSYIFFAADGASDPRDVDRIASAYEQDYPFVLGTRTKWLSNWRIMRLSHVIANFGLGLWCGLLTGRRFTDLGPLRLIDRELFETLALREMTFGWTIEAQIGAARLGAASREIPVRERLRLAGQQKVSGVTWWRTFLIGCRIVAAGWRARLRYAKGVGRTAARPITNLLPQP
jgi:glycosyltransferase involved in cell wall biosynthesis